MRGLSSVLNLRTTPPHASPTALCISDWHFGKTSAIAAQVASSNSCVKVGNSRCLNTDEIVARTIVRVVGGRVRGRRRSKAEIMIS